MKKSNQESATNGRSDYGWSDPPPGKNKTVKISQTLSIPKSQLKPMKASMFGLVPAKKT